MSYTSNQSGDTTTGAVVLYMLVLDQQSNGAAATVGDVIRDVTGNDTLAFRNLDNDERFVILYDKFVNVNPQSSAGTATPYTTLTYGPVKKINKKVNIPINYSATSSAITGVRSNNLFLLIIATGANVSTK